MDSSETQSAAAPVAVQAPVGTPEPVKQPTKSEYSGIGILVSFMLVITLVVFVQYVIGDLQERYAGSRPQMSAVLTYQQDEGNTYLEKNTGKSFSSAEANDYFNKTYMLPYESKRLVIGTLVNVPVFIVAVLLLLGKGTMRSSVRLGINAVFAASLLNMLRLLGELASFAYTVNQKMTMYGVSAILILVFFGSIVFIQEKHAKTNP